MSDPINHPEHYTHSNIEPIDVIESWGLDFHLGNVVKYVCRQGRKLTAKDEAEDLKKARWYLDRKIESLKSDKSEPVCDCGCGETDSSKIISDILEVHREEQEKNDKEWWINGSKGKFW